MFLLNFNQKHKNRLFIIGKTDLIVSFPCPASLRDVSNLTLDKRASFRSPYAQGAGGLGDGDEGDHDSSGCRLGRALPSTQRLLQNAPRVRRPLVVDATR